MELHEIKWRLDDLVAKQDREIKQAQDDLLKAMKELASYEGALITCRDMLERALPFLSGNELEKDFRIYLNIVSDVIGDFGKMNIKTPKEHGEWLNEQLNKRDY